MKTKIIINLDNEYAKFKVYRKECGFLKSWDYDTYFKTLEDAQRHAQELSMHPHPIAIYKNGKKIK